MVTESKLSTVRLSAWMQWPGTGLGHR